MIVRISSGRLKLRVDFPPGSSATLRDSLLRATANHPDTAAWWSDEAGRLRENLQIFVNGENARYRNGLDTLLTDGDEVYVIPLIAGG
jgi:molybdopterin converting factor small subunit